MTKTAFKSLLLLLIAVLLLSFLISTNNKLQFISEKEQLEDCEISIIFGGDLMLDRYIRTIGERKGYEHVFENISSYLQNSDGVIANLEGPITNNKSVSQYSEIGSRENFIFTIDPEVTPVLKQNNIIAVNLGNNHIYNFGQNGVDQTKLYLKEMDIKHIGFDNDPLYLNIKGNILALFNYNQFYPTTDIDLLAEKIKKAEDAGYFIIVFAHWGNEYETEANEHYQDTAHKLIDSGADFVVGSHPHVVQQSEIYNGKYIYYSLGNLTADQYFSQETRTGMLLKLKMNCKNNNISLEEKTIYMRTNGQTTF